MRIGIPKEIVPGETRVSVIPKLVVSLTRQEHEVLVENGAGNASSHDDQEYVEAGARICDVRSLYESSDVILKVQAPANHPAVGVHEANLVRENGILLGFLSPLANPDLIQVLRDRKITAFSMEYVPRISRAQSMDALSSMATIAGYKAVLMAADKLPKMFPLLMTAAGTVAPANVFVLGVGVAGLQAIATAKRLGAKVEAFDPRPAVREQVQSLGASFIDMEVPEDVETAGGYAKEQAQDFIERERKVILARLSRVDVVITTAQIFGKRAPLLITSKMVEQLRPGSIIVDLAAEQGGNCESTEMDKVVEHHGVCIMGPVNLPAALPVHSSQMYGKNITDLFLHLYPKDAETLDLSDEIVAGTCMTHDGQVLNEQVRKMLEHGGSTT